MSFLIQEQNDDLNSLARTCERCGIVVPADQPLCRVPGFDSKVCDPCLTDELYEAGGRVKKASDDLKTLVGMRNVEDLARSGNIEQAARLLREIFNNVRKH